MKTGVGSANNNKLSLVGNRDCFAPKSFDINPYIGETIPTNESLLYYWHYLLLFSCSCPNITQDKTLYRHSGNYANAKHIFQELSKSFYLP